MQEQQSPTELVRRLDQAIETLRAKGVRIHPGSRFPTYLKVLRSALAKGRIDDGAVFSRANLDSSQLVAAVEHLLGGPEERDHLPAFQIAVADAAVPAAGSNTPGRDKQFELYLASLFKCGGLEVTPEEPDIVVVVGGLRVGVAAKRPKSWAQLARRLRDGVRQLQREGRAHRITHGVLAIDVTDLANPEGDIFLTSEIPTGPPVAAQLTARVKDRVVDYVQRRMSKEAKTEGLQLNAAVLVFAAATHIVQDGRDLGTMNSRQIDSLTLRDRRREMHFDHAVQALRKAAETCFRCEGVAPTRRDGVSTARAAGKRYIKEWSLFVTFFVVVVTFSNVAYKIIGIRLIPIFETAFDAFHDWCHFALHIIVYSWLTFLVEWAWYGLVWLLSLLTPIVPWRPHIVVPGIVTDVALVSLALTRVFQTTDLIVPRSDREAAEEAMTRDQWEEIETVEGPFWGPMHRFLHRTNARVWQLIETILPIASFPFRSFSRIQKAIRALLITIAGTVFMWGFIRVGGYLINVYACRRLSSPIMNVRRRFFRYFCWNMIGGIVAASAFIVVNGWLAEWTAP